MAGCYNDPTPMGGYGYIDQGNLQQQLRQERLNNKILRDELHSQRMSVKSTGDKMKKMRLQNSELIDEIRSLRNSQSNAKEITELQDTVEEYEKIINRLNSERNESEENEMARESLNDKIRNLEKNIHALYQENNDHQKTLSQLRTLFASAQAESFSNAQTIARIHSLLSPDRISIKPDPSASPPNPSSPSDHSLALPFLHYTRPGSEALSKMHLLNSTIEKCVRAAALPQKTEFAQLAVAHFNQAQFSVFLYPLTASFVTEAESKGNAPSDFADSRLKDGQMVVERHWPCVLKEFRTHSKRLPPILALIAKEEAEGGRKYVLYALDFANGAVLRYDPLGRDIASRSYRAVYAAVFAEFGKTSQWRRKHLVEESKGISWLYCVEFARRLAIYIGDRGLESASRTLMQGSPGDALGFGSIDFDLMM